MSWLENTYYDLRSWWGEHQQSRQERNLVRWIEALLSGDYKQGRCQLKNGDCYCPLGVAAKALGVPELGPWFFFGIGAGYVSTQYPPQRWFEKTFGGRVQRYVIVHRNDQHGDTFVQTAGYLTHFLPNSMKKAELQ